MATPTQIENLSQVIAKWLDHNHPDSVDLYRADADPDSDGMAYIEGEINIHALARTILEETL